jgi:hypothetical protein
VSTIDQVRRVLGRIELTGTLRVLQLMVGCTEEHDTVLIWVQARVPPRDDPDAASRITISHSTRIPTTARAPDDAIVREVHKLIASLLVHEVAEGFVYEGVRLFDPHD